MSTSTSSGREGGLEAPTRHPIPWQTDEFWDAKALQDELTRVFDICHGCRRCVSLCNSFPTLFDLVDESSTMEVDGVDPADYMKVVDECYLCDLCYQTKCPYVPPHEWNLDYPHLMLRAKAHKFRAGDVKRRDRVLTSTTRVGKLASLPIVVQAVNGANRSKVGRKLVEKTLGVHPDAPVPEYHRSTLRRRSVALDKGSADEPVATERTSGRVAIFATCYGNYNQPQIGVDLIAVLRHNKIQSRLLDSEVCCGMPKLELGDLQSVDQLRRQNIPVMAAAVRDGWDLMAPIPSCVLMFKQELPLLFPDDDEVQLVRSAMFDPFEYLHLRHREGLLNTQFSQSLGSVAYHAPCHQRVQNIGPKTVDVLSLVPDTQVTTIERCSGHDGTYGVRKATYEAAQKIARPVVNRVRKAEPDHFSSDCPMAGHQIAHGLGDGAAASHPLSLLRHAYGI